jgi:hypothetical protein
VDRYQLCERRRYNIKKFVHRGVIKGTTGDAVCPEGGFRVDPDP